MNTEISIEQRAEVFACNAHDLVNHRYDGMSYGTHLAMVVGFAKRFIHCLPNNTEHLKSTVIAACWLHDTIEDCRLTYNDIFKEFGFDVAEIVYALTNEKGKTRKERANDKYYWGIKCTYCATFVKVCDRLANVQYSINTKSRMLDAYRKENRYFTEKLYEVQYDEMFRLLTSLLNIDQEVPVSDTTEAK